MKKITTITVALLITVVSFGQAKQPAVKDSLTQSTPLLSITDVNDLIGQLSKKFTVEKLQDFQDITKWLDEKVRQRIAEFNSKPKK